MEPVAVSVRVGKTMYLSCVASGNPPPIISWLFNGRPFRITSNSANRLEASLNKGKWQIGESLTISKLIVPCVKKKNEGYYKCVASNGRKRIESEIKVTIHRGRRCRWKKAFHAPIITMWTSERMENVNRSAQLFCRTIGKVPRSIRWFYSNGSQVDRKLFKILPNGDLLIPNILPDMMDVYICVAKNTFGEDRISAWFMPMDPEDNLLPPT